MIITIIILVLCILLTVAVYMLARARRHLAMDGRTIGDLYSQLWDTQQWSAKDKATIKHRDQLLVNRLIALHAVQGERDRYMHLCSDLLRTLQGQGITLDGVLQEMRYTAEEPDVRTTSDN